MFITDYAFSMLCVYDKMEKITNNVNFHGNKVIPRNVDGKGTGILRKVLSLVFTSWYFSVLPKDWL